MGFDFMSFYEFEKLANEKMEIKEIQNAKRKG